MPAAHDSRVRALYRRILLLHRALPPDLKALGDQRMQQCYGNKLTKTAKIQLKKACFGAALPEEKLNDFRDEQIGQLQVLMQEATKPNRQFSITESGKPKC